MRQAIAAAGGVVDEHGRRPPGEAMPLEDAVRTLFYEFTEVGIPPSEWTRWSLDAVEMYWDERLRRDEEMGDQIRSHQRASSAAKVAPRIYYSIPVR